jgi:hypothetical protein
MDYLHVHWRHDAADAPADIYSELDDDRWEVRKVEAFPDGTLHYADDWRSTGRTGLSEVPLPSFEDLAGQDALTPAVIDAAEFERMWTRATKD